MIVAEVDRLRWRIWNGKAKNAGLNIGRIRKVMQLYRGDYARSAPSRRLWNGLHNVDDYLRSQSNWLVKSPRDIAMGSAPVVRSPKARPTSLSTDV